MTPLYVKLLGVTVATHGQSAVPLTCREAVLVGYLAECAPKTVKRTKIAQLLWPQSSDHRGLRSLSQLLYEIRRKLPDVPLITTSSEVGVTPIQTDLGEVRRLVEDRDWLGAIQLYNGQPFGQLEMPSQDLDLWRTSLVTETADLITAALQLGVAAVTERRELELIAQVAEALIQSGAAPPTAYDIAIFAHLRSGADRAAESIHTALNDVYGDVMTIGSFSDYKETARRSLTDQEDVQNHVRFVGRHDELTELQRTWEQAARGSGKVVLISGEPGIGKSRLVDQFLRRVAISGGRVWAGRCHAATRRSPLAAVAGLLSEHNLYRDPSLPAEMRESLDAILHSGLTAPDSTQHSGRYWHHKWLEALAQIPIHVSRSRPLVLFIDDVQWADDLTAQVLTLWALRVPALSVLLIMTARTEEADPLPEWISYDLNASLRIRLGQLSIEAASELLEAFVANGPVQLSVEARNRVLWQSAGRPLLLLEALSEASRCPEQATEAGRVFLPETAEHLLRRRFRGLSTDAVWLTGLAAAYGTAIKPQLLAEMSGLRDDAAMAALDSLNARGILELVDQKLDFPHDLMRETAYRFVAPATRVLLHRRVAVEMSRRGGADGFLADHFAAAGDTQMAGTHALAAARDAQSHGSYSDCIHYYRLVLDAGEQDHRCTAARELARYLAQIGRLSEAEPVLPILRGQGTREASLLVDLIELERELVGGSASNALTRAKGILEQAVALQSFELAMVLGPLLDVAHDAGNLSFAAQLLSSYEEAAREIGDSAFTVQVQVLTATWEGTTVGYKPGLDRLAQLSIESRKLPPSTETLAWYAKGTLLLLAGELRGAVEALDRAASLAKNTGDVRRAAAAEMNMSVALTELCDYERARCNLEGLLGSPHRAYKLRAYTNLAILQYERGEDNLATNTAQAVLVANQSYGSAKYRAIAAALMGLVALRQRDTRMAALHYDWLTDNSSEQDFLTGDPGYTVSFVAHMLSGREEQACALRLLDRAIETAAPRDYISGLRLSLSRARVLASIGDERAYGEAKSVLQAAVVAGAESIARYASDLAEQIR